jgi:Polysaccharide lyase family 4, domain II
MERRLLATIFMAVLSVGALTRAYAGSIAGEVKFADAPPKLSAIKVTKDQDYCGQSVPNESYLMDSNGGLRNVVVFIEVSSISGQAPQKENILDNNGCRFSPRVLAIRKGDRLIVKNSDPKLHIAHSYLNQRTVFTLSLPFRGTTLDATKKIRQPGILKVSCDTHAWMRSYIHVFDHPFFAVTDERGSFSIPNLPAGKYMLKAWHEEAGIKSQEITVSENETRVNFEFAGK